ncbi:hypothetical protein BDC45DRAFT_536098 [Circinella umbellata]|nr:hypothetical protein BDC45DRAFT_536098 [Circinella umbellata]
MCHRLRQKLLILYLRIIGCPVFTTKNQRITLCFFSGQIFTEDVLKSINQNISSNSDNLIETSGTNTSTTDRITEHPDIKIPSIKDRYRVGKTDVSLQFYAFQLVSKNNYKELLMETHVQQILTLSSVFLIQKDKYNDDLKSIMGKKMLDDIEDKL